MTTEYVTSGAPALGEHDTLLQPLLDRWTTAPDAPMFARREGDRFVDISTKEALDLIRGAARGLIHRGIGPGDRVMLMSRTRVEWAYLDYAILSVGAATVPVFETSSAEQIRWIVKDSGARLAIVEDATLAALFAEVADDLPDCRDILVIDDGALAELTEAGREVPDADLDARTAALTIDDVATIIYTSGTTGRPKGCVLTHANLRANTLQVRAHLGHLVEPGDRTLLFLPMAHSFAKILFFFPVEMGVPVAFATDLAALPEELPLVAPNWVAAVPRVFEKVYAAAERKAVEGGKERIFARAMEIASRWSVESLRGTPALSTRILHAVFDRLVYGKLRAAFGGNLRFAFSGGGPLGERLTHVFRGAGIIVLEGYGLTETSPVLTANLPEAWEVGSVGRPVPGTAIRIAEDGEILARGPQVFTGYWKNEEATGAAIDGDGWFHTGDLGGLDTDGFVRITGRKKDIIVTAGGKNVAPAFLEDLLRAHSLISQAVVLGDRRPFITALVTIDEEAFATWAPEHGHTGRPVADLIDDPTLRATVQEAVDDANRAVSRAESIRAFAILPHDLKVEDDELTPTLKVKRNLVLERERATIERLYSR